MSFIVAFLLVLGLVLIAVEVIVLPGLGFIGFLGATLVIAASALAHLYLSSGETVWAMFGGAGTTILMFWLLPKTRLANSMVLHTRLETSATDERTLALLGKTGLTATVLRPAGHMHLEQMLIDVVSDGMYIASGTRVVVIEVKGNRVVVQALD